MAVQDNYPWPETIDSNRFPHSFLASRYLLASALVLLISDQSFANGGSYRSEDRYDHDHIESLPPEILDAVIHR
jgi:hypothetical protein